jgi:hypothetical protein
MKREILFAVLVAGFVFSVFGQNASDFEYKIENNSITITGYKGSEKDITIPEKINGLPVTSIGVKAFTQQRLNNVVFPDTLAVIGNNAFSYNRLTNVTFPASVVTIDYMAFSNNRLANITLPNTIAYIGINAFAANRLKKLTLPASLDYIGDGAFSRNLLDSVSVSNTVRNFNSYAFDSYVKITWY